MNGSNRGGYSPLFPYRQEFSELGERRQQPGAMPFAGNENPVTGSPRGHVG